VAVPALLVSLWRLRAATRAGDRLRFTVVLFTFVVGAVLLYADAAMTLVEFRDDRSLTQGFGIAAGAAGIFAYIGMGQFAGAMRQWTRRHGCSREIVVYWRRTTAVTWSVLIGLPVVAAATLLPWDSLADVPGASVVALIAFLGLGVLAMAPIWMTWGASTATRKHLEVRLP
jgi:hypothetical protein